MLVAEVQLARKLGAHPGLSIRIGASVLVVKMRHWNARPQAF